MSNDLYIAQGNHDIYLEDNSRIRLCETVEELTRQRISITLKTFLGEWFANINFGTPYFQSIFGKNTKAATDVALKGLISGVDGVQELVFYKSVLDKQTRKLSVTFKVISESGKIIQEEISL